MSKLSQKESIYNAIKSYLVDKGIHHDDGEKVNLTKEDRKAIITMVTNAALNGHMELKENAQKKYMGDEKAMYGYVDGLVSNWLRKDTRLNGGDPYKIKQPGSRTGQKDPTIKSLKALRKKVTQPAHLEKIDAAITKRQQQILIEKTQHIEVDEQFIPENLKFLLEV